jgi:hypothetical protein
MRDEHTPQRTPQARIVVDDENRHPWKCGEAV